MRRTIFSEPLPPHPEVPVTRRSLTLKKDTLTELSSDELTGVVGGITTLLLASLQACGETNQYPSFPVLYCVTDLTS